jgi:hypothetical protein
LPPLGEPSRWNMRSRTRATRRPASPLTWKRRNERFTGDASASSVAALPKFAPGAEASTYVSAVGVNVSESPPSGS